MKNEALGKPVKIWISATQHHRFGLKIGKFLKQHSI